MPLLITSYSPLIQMRGEGGGVEVLYLVTQGNISGYNFR